MSVNSRLKTTYTIGQRKEFYRQRIPQSSCVRKEIVDIDILVTSRNGDRKILKSQMNIYQSNAYRKDLSWLHFDDAPRLQERQQVKDTQSCISFFVSYPTIPSSN